MKKWFWAYIAGFIALTGADLASTILGIAAGASEFNHTVATSGGDLKTGLFLARLGYVGGPLGLVIGLGLGRIGVLPNVGVQSNPVVIWMAAATFVVLWVWSIRAARRHKLTLANLRAQSTIADAFGEEL
jgi:hypothetical protein